MTSAGAPPTNAVWLDSLDLSKMVQRRQTPRAGQTLALKPRATAQPESGLAATEMTATWPELGVSGPRMVHDLWRQRDLGTIDRQFSVRVPAHRAVMFRVRRP